jgi:hypothetical protein
MIPEIKQLADYAIWLWTIGLSITVWLRKPGEDAGKSVGALRDEYLKRVQGVDMRLATIDEKLLNVPTSTELAKLEGSVKVIHQQVSGISDGMTRQTKQLDRIEEYLLNNK